MALAFSTGPVGNDPSGTFADGDLRHPAIYWEPYRRSLRVRCGDDDVVKSDAVLALHRPGELMTLCVPRGDIDLNALVEGEISENEMLGRLKAYDIPAGNRLVEMFDAPPPALAGLRDYAIVDVGAATAWYLEEELGYAHPRDPYHRFDVHRTSRHIAVLKDGVTVAETRNGALLAETSTPLRYYLPPDAVRTDLLVKSETVSQCPYKGDGQHWHLDLPGGRKDDAVWSLVTPMGDAMRIPRWFCFYPEKVDIIVDGEQI